MSTPGPRPDALPLRHVLTLPAMGPAVRIARETTEQVLAEWGISRRHRTVGPALLIVSELVTNSVRHAASHSPSITVHYAAGRGTFAFAVHDRHPHRPALLAAVPRPGTGGGGLGTVMELTLGLGGTAVVRGDADGGGKSIWITLPL